MGLGMGAMDWLKMKQNTGLGTELDMGMGWYWDSGRPGGGNYIMEQELGNKLRLCMGFVWS